MRYAGWCAGCLAGEPRGYGDVKNRAAVHPLSSRRCGSRTAVPLPQTGAVAGPASPQGPATAPPREGPQWMS